MTDNSYLDEIKKSKAQKPTPPEETGKPNRRPKGLPTLSLAVRISVEDSNLLDQICADRGWSRTQAVVEAIHTLNKGH